VEKEAAAKKEAAEEKKRIKEAKKELEETYVKSDTPETPETPAKPAETSETPAETTVKPAETSETSEAPVETPFTGGEVEIPEDIQEAREEAGKLLLILEDRVETVGRNELTALIKGLTTLLKVIS
jgi:hypothetical protein